MKLRRRRVREVLVSFFPKPIRSHQIMLRLSPKEYQNILVHAGEAGKVPAVYVRDMVVEGRTTPKGVAQALREFSRELRKIGGNVNQVAHHTNAQQGISPKNLQMFVGMLRKVDRVVREAVKKSEEF